MSESPFTACLPRDAPEYVALWAEAVYWRQVDGSAVEAARRLQVSRRTVQRRCANFYRWMRHQVETRNR